MFNRNYFQMTCFSCLQLCGQGLLIVWGWFPGSFRVPRLFFSSPKRDPGITWILWQMKLIQQSCGAGIVKPLWNYPRFATTPCIVHRKRDDEKRGIATNISHWAGMFSYLALFSSPTRIFLVLLHTQMVSHGNIVYPAIFKHDKLQIRRLPGDVPANHIRLLEGNSRYPEMMLGGFIDIVEHGVHHTHCFCFFQWEVRMVYYIHYRNSAQPLSGCRGGHNHTQSVSHVHYLF